MRNKRRTRREGRRFFVLAFATAVGLMAIAMPAIPSPALGSGASACSSSPATRCCACGDTDGEFYCHGGAYMGSPYCDEGTEFCERRLCRSPQLQ